MWQTRPVEDYLLFLHGSNTLAEVPPGHRCYFYTDNFVNLNVVSLQNDPPLVSNVHLFSIIGVFLKLSLKIMACRDRRISIVTFFELSKYGLSSSKFQACRTRVSP